MASTEQRTGFHFPWDSAPAPVRTQDEEATRSDEGVSAPTATDPTAPETGTPEARAEMTSDTPGPAGPEAPTSDETGYTPEASTEDTAAPAWSSAEATAPTFETTPAEAPTPTTAPTPASSNRLMDGLVRAMRTAAEETRGASLEQMRTEAKERIEQIHARSGEDVAALRHDSDEEIASIREWSKAEIARIRSETDTRIDRCKQNLDSDLEGHAARVERQIEEVQARVERFEAEMTAFFDTLEAIEEPSAFAAAAARLPEPPSLDELETPAVPEPPRSRYAGWFGERTEATGSVGDPDALAQGSAAAAPEESSSLEEAESPRAELAAEEPAPTEPTGYVPPPYVTHDDPPNEAQDQAETPAADAQAASPLVGWSEVTQPAADAGDPAQTTTADRSDLEVAEREAAVESEVAFGSADDDGESIGQDALAARLGMLAGFPSASPAGSDEPMVGSDDPEAASDEAAPTDANPVASTRLVVVGLVSVSSIAAFKRQLVAIEGVRAVGVSSGPDGEFVFKVDHEPILALQDVLPSLPGFQPRVVSSAEGTIQVSASDPDLHS